MIKFFNNSMSPSSSKFPISSMSHISSRKKSYLVLIATLYKHMYTLVRMNETKQGERKKKTPSLPPCACAILACVDRVSHQRVG